jgi:molybdate transport system substrate-binding protein
VVSREADVRASVNRVRLGDADAAFAYRSDVTPDVREQVQTVTIPEEYNVVAAYPISVLADAGEPELARAWVDLVMGAGGQKVLVKWGFEPAP